MKGIPVSIAFFMKKLKCFLIMDLKDSVIVGKVKSLSHGLGHCKVLKLKLGSTR